MFTWSATVDAQIDFVNAAWLAFRVWDQSHHDEVHSADAIVVLGASGGILLSSWLTPVVSNLALERVGEGASIASSVNWRVVRSDYLASPRMTSPADARS